MADNKIELEIVLDDGSIKRAFATVKKEGDDAAKGLGDSFKVNGLADFTAGLYLVQRAANAVGASLKKAFDLTLEGEQIAAVGKRFEILSSQAGLSAENIESGIKRAVDGTVDLDQALQEASKTLITLGPNAAKIPELFELARKSAQGFGGTTIENFEKLSQAIASGNTRILRSIGINIDASRAVSQYEKSIGAAAGSLTEHGKQQAILNSILDKGGDSFKNINGSITPLSESYQKLNASTKSLGDTTASVFTNVFGTAVKNALDRATLSLSSFNVKLGELLLGKTATASEQITVLSNSIRELTISQDLATARGDIGRVEQIQFEIDSLNQKLLIQKSIDLQKQTSLALNEQERADQQDGIIKTHELTEAQKKQAQELADLQYTTANFFKGFTEGANKIAGSMKQLGSAVAGTLIGGLTNAFSALGQALARGEDAFGAFGRAVLGTIGQLAIQIGQFMVLQALGFSLLPGQQQALGSLPFGLALITLGGVLSAVASSGGSPGGVGGGGVNAATPADKAGFGTPLALNEQGSLSREANTAVQVTIQGDVLDSDATGTRIVQLLNDAFDKQGVVVRGTA